MRYPRRGRGPASAGVGCERRAELIARLCLTEAVLGPELIVGRGEPAVRAVEQVHGSGACRRSNALRGHPDREVGVAVPVQVAGGERGAERVARLGGVENAGAVLAPELVAGRAEPGP